MARGLPVRDVPMEGQLPRRGLAALARGEGMTRIGKVKTAGDYKVGAPCFQLVVEGGRVTLGCWRLIGRAEAGGDFVAIFERIS